jgi:hypothetical protein
MKKNKWIVLLGAAFIGLGSCEEVLERSLVDKKVVLQAPMNNLITTDSIHDLYWQQMDGATEYEIQIVTPRFDSIARMVADEIQEELKYNIELKKGIYQWRVRAKNTSTTSNFSDAWTITIQ